MKSIKTYLLPLILITFFSFQGFSQSESETAKKEEISKTDSILVYGYFTESDYNEIHGIEKPQKNTDSEFYYGDETSSDKEQKKNERDSFFAEVAAEVVVEVVINAIFIIATFWH